MKKYEYIHEYLPFFPPSEEEDSGKEIWSSMIQACLNRYESKGWELVSMDPSVLNMERLDGYAVFRREIPHSEMFNLYEAIQKLQEELVEHHHDAEIGCVDYKAIKALGATYELLDYIASIIPMNEAMKDDFE